MKHRLLSLLLVVFLFFLVNPVRAEETTSWTPPVITPLQKGTPAPFSGILLTPEAVAKVIAEAKDCPKRLEVEVDKARSEEKALAEKRLADAQADAKRDKAIMQASIDQKNGMLKDLGNRLEQSERARNNNMWYFAGGTAVVVLSIIIVGAVAN